MSGIKISFGIIVLNGEPYSRYNISALYPHAHQIVIVEGACYGAKSIADANGHSTDGTLEILRKIKEHDDPKNKITIVTAEDEGYPDGFWPGEKHEQSQAFTKRVTGNYLWQVDIDEFYKDEDIAKIKNLLSEDPAITCISFAQYSFWGGFDYLVDTWYFKRHLPEIFRIFKWEKGYRYISHRPPTVINEKNVELKNIKHLNALQTKKLGVYLYHYSFVFPKQVDEKVKYYSNVTWSKLDHTKWWIEEVYYKLKHPFKIFIIDKFPAWLNYFKGEHPLAISELIYNLKDIHQGIIMRQTYDIEKLLQSRWYNILKYLVKYYDYIDRMLNFSKRKIKYMINYANRHRNKNIG